MPPKHVEALLKPRVLNSAPRASDSVGLDRGLGVRISNKFPVADGPRQQSTRSATDLSVARFPGQHTKISAVPRAGVR